jgi:glyoxylase-like metal-dependent hydrolase (beta-lactamase superfamily II)
LPATIQIGSTTIHRIVEQEGPFFEAMKFFPDITKELLDQNRGWLQPRFLDARDQLMLCIQSYIVKTPHHTIMIDSCVGNHKPRPTRPFWHMMNSDRYEKNLAASGFGVDDIDFVMCTHLHTDHVGWNTRLENGRWVPTFPKARYVFADRELDYWTRRHQDDPAACPWITDSVLPIVAANRVDIVNSAHAFNDLVTLIPTPGHTIDHYSVQVGKPGADAVIAGDMIHSPLQARYPELGMMSDYDSAIAGQSRRK